MVNMTSLTSESTPKTHDASKPDRRDAFIEPPSFEGAVGELEKTYTPNSLPASDGYPQPPPEILQMIFERTIPPHFLLDPSDNTTLSPMSLWSKVSRQKKSLINVCRAWYQVGLPFLYGDVVILRVPQFLRLLRTLQVPNRDYRRLVKSIGLYCHIPSEIRLIFGTKLALFFPLCPNVTSFSFHSPVRGDDWTSWDLKSTFNNITRLSVDNLEIDLVMQMVHMSARTLVSLYIGYFIEFGDKSLEDQELHLPCLEDFSIPDYWRLYMNFTLPCLKRLTVFHSDIYMNGENLRDVILRTHGPNLKYLHISPKFKKLFLTRVGEDGLAPTIPGSVFQSFLDLCPSLEHVVLHSEVMGHSGQLTHPKVKWIDIWEPFQCDPPVGVECSSQRNISNWFSVRKSITNDAFPSLQGVRQISSAFCAFQDLPMIFPPRQVQTASEEFACTFLDMDVHSDVTRVYGHIPPLTIDCPEGYYTSNTVFSMYSYDEPVENMDEQERKALGLADPDTHDDDEDSDSDYSDSSMESGSSSSDSDLLSEGSADSLDWELDTQAPAGEQLVVITDIDWRELVLASESD